MKLRILDNKIRLRLERQEVATIIAGGSVGGATNFPAGERLRYRLATDNEKTSATFREGEIVILLHKPTATIWGLDETKISLDAVLPNAEGGLHRKRPASAALCCVHLT